MTDVAVFADTFGGRGFVLPNDQGGAMFVPSEIIVALQNEPWVVTMVIVTDLTADGASSEIIELKLTKRDDGPAIRADLIRGIKLGEAMRSALHEASTPLERVALNNGGEAWRVADTASPRNHTSTTIEKVVRRQQRNSKVDDQIERAAQVYRSAAGEKYVAVAEALGVSRATAARRVARAREIGVLGAQD